MVNINLIPMQTFFEKDSAIKNETSTKIKKYTKFAHLLECYEKSTPAFVVPRIYMEEMLKLTARS